MLKSRLSREVQLGMVSKFRWEHYGDINLSQGASFVRYDEIFDQYNVIVIDYDEHTECYMVSDTEFSIEDMEEHIDTVKEFCDFQEGRDDYLYLANEFVAYFGSEDLGGTIETFETLEDATQRLIDLQVVAEL